MGTKRSGGHEQPKARTWGLTRRQLLTATTAAALGAGPLAAVLVGRMVRFRRVGQQRAYFDLNGGPGWAIDTAWFDGEPRLLVEERPDRLLLSLSGARYPGTELPADFTAEILPAEGDEGFARASNLDQATLNLNLSFASLAFTGLPLGAWLAGEVPAEAGATLGDGCRLAGGCALSASGRARASFSPDWTVHVAGPGVGSLTAEGYDLRGDALSVRLPEKGRARLVLARGRQDWPALALPSSAAQGSLSGGKNLFATATLDLGAASSRLTLQGDSAASRLHFIPAAGLSGADGSPLRVPLTNPTYTVSHANGQVTQSLVAEYSKSPVWVQAKGAVLQLGSTDTTPAFEWHATDRETTAVFFRPAVLAMGISSMQGLLVHPTLANPASAVSLTADGSGLAIDLSAVEITRPEDLLTLRFAFTNMTLKMDDTGLPYLEPTTEGATGTVEITFPPQHISEEAVPEFDVSVNPRPEPTPPIAHRAAGPTTLTFETGSRIDFTLESLLNWEQFTVPTGGNGELEAPYKLRYQLPAAAAWLHANRPVTGGKWTELWHTRSARALDMPVQTDTDYGSMGKPNFEQSPSEFDRTHLQSQTQTRPIHVENLMLSSLGAWMKANGEWGDTATIQSYFHQMAMGRDGKVVVVYSGYLFPFGHKATLVVVTERKFRKGRAYLYRKKFIVVREPVRSYGDDETGHNNEREFPFRQVEMTTRVTPPLDAAPVANGRFWIKVNKAEYPFRVVTTDWLGERAEFAARLMFVVSSDDGATTAANAQLAIGDYGLLAGLPQRQIELQGQPVAYALPTPGVSGDQTTRLDTGLVELGVTTRTDRPFFRPTVSHAMVRVPAIEQFVAEGQRVKIILHDLYITHGFDAPNNRWEVFARFDQMWKPSMPASTSGGIATPEINFRALSRRFGAIGLDPVTGTEQYDPTQYFGQNAKVIGALPFAGILSNQTIGPAPGGLSPMTALAEEEEEANAPPVIPTFTVKVEPVMEDEKKVAEQLRIQMELNVTGAVGIKEIPNFFYTREETALKLSASILRILKTYPTPGATPPAPGTQQKKWHYEVAGSLEWFTLKLYFLSIYFKKVGFTYNSFAKKKMSPEIELDPENSFLPDGPLTFLSMFLDKSPTSVTGSNPPDPGDDAIELGLSIRIPDYSTPPSPPVGPAPVPRWEITNVEPWFKIKFYLDGSPLRFGLGISSEESPFRVLYWMKPEFALFGQGFFAVEFEPGMLRGLQVLLEVGALLSIEKTLKLGILKGEVSLSLGFYFELSVNDNRQTSVEVTGFLRLCGTVGIKIIEVSLEIYLAVTYKAPAGEEDYWIGTARITIKVKLWLFSFSWSYQYTQRLSGSKGSNTAYAVPDHEDQPLLARHERGTRNAVAYCTAFCNSDTERLV